ncbi:MAG TPA: hypothetical protein VNU48_14320 [Burkholderiaceae bacterium]|nr:hypothetical protein [Burkholderiaceae bacterium]
MVATALAVVLGLHGPIAQWAGYHAFADGRAWFGVPNAENVLSNLPFALVGGWGLWAVAHLPQARGGRSAWACFGAAVLCTAFGSALYHWAPSNGALVFDRLPIAWACAALTCALLAERVDARWASPAALTLALLVATASVAWWWLGEHRGVGDLRAYLFVQFLPMALVPAAIGLKLPRGAAGGGLRDRDWWIVLGLYALAKLTELADRPVLEALGLVSGHTLKHLFAAAAALWLLRAATRPLRRPRALATAPIGRTQLR